jgi:hypothetical protein
MQVTSHVRHSETTYKGWKAHCIEVGDLKVIVTPQIGGRIMGCAYRGQEILYTHKDFEGVVEPQPIGIKELKDIKRANGFRFYGGYKTWISPQDTWQDELPYYDLDSGIYTCSTRRTARDFRVVLKSPVCRESGVQLDKELVFTPSLNLFQIQQGMTNCSDKSVSLGLWDVTQVLRPAYVFIPIRSKTPFADGLKIFDVENKDHAAVLKYVDKRGTYDIIRCTDEIRFKVGSDAEEGWLAGFIPYRKNRWIVFKKTFETFPGTRFGHDCSGEVFNSDERPHLEMEVHAPLISLKSGMRFTWMGQWSFTDIDELPRNRQEIEALFNRI